MSVVRLETEVRLPRDEEALLSGDPRRIKEFLDEFTNKLEELLEDLSDRINRVIDLNDGDAIYSNPKGTDGSYPEGTWRLKKAGNDWQSQVYLSGVWDDGDAFERPIV